MEKLFSCDDCGNPTNNQRIIKMSYGNDLIIHRCGDCQDKLDAEVDWQNEQFKESNIICPWCEDTFSDYEDMSKITDSPYEDFEGNVKCPTCGKEFELEIETRCNYTTRKPSEQFIYEKWLQSEVEE